jgi:alanine racemase
MAITRRGFLAGGITMAGAAAVSAAGTGPQVASGGATSVDQSFDPWVEVNGANLRHNVSEIGRHVGGRPVLAVIKNNGYGLGVVNAARLLEPLQAVSGLAVVKLDEAIRLRDAGMRKPVLLLGPLGGHEMDEAVARDIMPMVYTPVGELLERVASRMGKPVPVTVCVDTGIGRVGVPYREAPALIRDLAARRSVRIEGVMMTFTEDASFDRQQLQRFRLLCDALAADGITLGRRHAASSYSLFGPRDAFLDMVRPGMAIFGVYSEPRFRTANMIDLKPALALRTRVVYVKRLAAGETAGYNRAYAPKHPSWVATLPVGHADGWPRVAANGACIRINGRECKVVASVSASHTIVELGQERFAGIGDVATLFDWEEGSRPEDVSRTCGASVYDLLMHLNPLLRRSMV